jgi:hypothetical protein
MRRPSFAAAHNGPSHSASDNGALKIRAHRHIVRIGSVITGRELPRQQTNPAMTDTPGGE